MSAIAILHADPVNYGRLWDVEFDALCTEEGPHGPRFVKWRQSRVDHSYTGETALASTQAPAEQASREAAPIQLQRRTAAACNYGGEL